MDAKLTESFEKYLLAIYEIVKTNKAARVKDVSKYLSIGGPSTSEAVKTLAAKNFINYEPYGIITLTQKGKEHAEEKIKRHTIISKFLQKVLLINEDKIDLSARQIEYSMPENVLNKFVNFLTFIETCSCQEPKWINGYKYFSTHNTMSEKCSNCIKNKKNCDNSLCCNQCSK